MRARVPVGARGACQVSRFEIEPKTRQVPGVPDLLARAPTRARVHMRVCLCAHTHARRPGAWYVWIFPQIDLAHVLGAWHGLHVVVCR